MTHKSPHPPFVVFGLLSALLLATAPPAQAQTQPTEPSTRPAPQSTSAVPTDLIGRIVEEVRILGQNKTLSPIAQSEIAHRIRTREGDTLDPATIEADYHRIYELRRFRNVEARVEPTTTGVIVVFEVVEPDLITQVRFQGNRRIDTATLKAAVDIAPGQAIDDYRLALAQDAIQRLYQGKNYSHAHVLVDRDELIRTGVLTFQIIEGPHVRVRKIQVLGNKTFGDGSIKKQARTRSWFPLFVAGRFDPEQLEQDVASIRRFYHDRGFFDVRVGRKVTVSPDQKEVMVSFLIDEGSQYLIDRITFKGNSRLSESQLRSELKLAEGQPYNQDRVRRDIRAIVRAYSPLGHIHAPQENDPDYLTIKDERLFSREPGKVHLVYNISEGKPFRVGRILVKGNSKTQDKVILRELRLTPGQLYNSDEVQRAIDRLKATNLFTQVTITPIKPANDSTGQPLN